MSSPEIQLRSVFTLKSMTAGAQFGVTFESDNGGYSYGGEITVQTPAAAGPVGTGLWDSDGNVFFDVVLLDAPQPASCTINAGSRPGTWNPYNTVFAQNGVQCEIIATSNDPTTNTFYYDLQLTVSSAAKTAAAAPAKPRASQAASVRSAASGEYVFNIALLDGSPLVVWQPGTLSLQLRGRLALGRLSVPGFYNEPLEVTGVVGGQYGQTGTLVHVSGKNSELSGELSFLYSFDGFLTTATFLGGTASILDYNAQETYLYVLQGATGQRDPAAARTAARKPRR